MLLQRRLNAAALPRSLCQALTQPRCKLKYVMLMLLTLPEILLVHNCDCVLEDADSTVLTNLTVCDFAYFAHPSKMSTAH